MEHGGHAMPHERMISVDIALQDLIPNKLLTPNDNIFQIEIVADASGSHNGLIAGLQYGMQWLYRNWNFYTLAGLRYFSSDVVDHYFSVSEEQSTALLPVYAGDDGVLPTVLAGAIFPDH